MVVLIIFIYIISSVWSCCFINWAFNKNIDYYKIILISACPILNTIFAGYRTYRHFKNGGKFFIKDLFAD